MVEQANGPQHRWGSVVLFATVRDEDVGLRRLCDEPESKARHGQALRSSMPPCTFGQESFASADCHRFVTFSPYERKIQALK